MWSIEKESGVNYITKLKNTIIPIKVTTFYIPISVNFEKEWKGVRKGQRTGENVSFNCHCWFLFILWWACWDANILYKPFWQEGSVESLILRWSLRLVVFLFSSMWNQSHRMLMFKSGNTRGVINKFVGWLYKIKPSYCMPMKLWTFLKHI